MKKHFATLLKELQYLYDLNKNDRKIVFIKSVEFFEQKYEDVILNKTLLERKGISSNNILKLKKLYCLYYFTFYLMDNNYTDVKKADKLLTEIEFGLQEIWGFEKDAKFHKFWLRPKCLCPIMDNQDRHPFGTYIFNSDCPLHGE